MRLAFLGTPEPAAVALRALVEAGHDVRMVVTRADKRRGRNSAPAPTPVKAAAQQLGLPVTTNIEDALTVGAELGVVVAFGRIIKADVLEALPMVNVHFSLLPRWRGAAPVERAIMAGDSETGVCLMAIDEGLDTGPIYCCESIPIEPDETAEHLRYRLSKLGADLLVQTLREGLGPTHPQVGEATYADKIEPTDVWLDWSRPAADLHRLVRLGRAWTSWRGKRLLVLGATVEGGPAEGGPAERPGQMQQPGQMEQPGQMPGQPGEVHDDRVTTGAGWLRLLTVQPEGRQSMPATAWLRGSRLQPGERLGTGPS